MADDENSDRFEVVDPTGLTDADWAEINKLEKAWNEGGTAALKRAMDVLGQGDSVRTIRIYAALFPHEIREAIRDFLAEIGVTEDDLRELLQELENRAKRKPLIN
jgi:hypothetical protein